MSWRASRANDLLRSANEDGGSSTTRLELFRRAALLADAEGDERTAIEARRAIMNCYLWTNSEVDMIAAFTWLLHSTATSEFSVLWTYKWFVAALTEIAAIRPELVELAIEDLERRYAVAGWSGAAAAQLRLEAAMTMRRRERLPELFEAWQRNESGAGSDCAACRRDKRVQYFSVMEDDERVVTESKPFIEGSLRCAEVPRGTYPLMLLPLLRTRRSAEADEVCRRGMEMLGASERIPTGIGAYLVYLAVRGRFPEGCAILTTWLRRVMLSRNDLRRFDFYRGAALLFRSADTRRPGDHASGSPADLGGIRVRRIVRCRTASRAV